MTDNKKTPDIRFQGFTDAWELRKFGELYEKVCEKNDLSYGTEKIISVANMYFKPDSRISDSEYLRTYNVFHLGDIAFEGNKSKNFAHGRFVENTIGNGIVSHVFDVFRPIMEYDLLFWKYVINNERIMGAVLIRSTKASTMMTNLVASDFLQEEILVPHVKEQKKIGVFFKRLDALITLHQRKCEKLKNIKKSMLEKMFPREGEKFPEIRFAGFTDAWELRKLGEITKILSASRVHKNEWKTEGVPFYRSSDVVSAFKGDKNDKVFISQELYEKLITTSGRLEKGDILITGGGSIGVPYIVPDDRALYSKDADLLWVKKSEKHESNFLYSYFICHRFRDYINSISHVGTIGHYTIEQVKDTPVALPTFGEQKEVGDFFIRLDALLTLHQRKCEKLKKVKSAMLERMFV